MKILVVRAYPGSGLRKQDQGWQNVVWSETAQKHEVPTAVLRNPNRPIKAVSSYRLLSDVLSFLFHFLFTRSNQSNVNTSTIFVFSICRLCPASSIMQILALE